MSIGFRNLARRERGAFFTPPALAAALAQWSIRKPTDRVLDPGAGNGELLLAAVAQLRHLGAAPGTERVEGIEIDAETAALACARLSIQGAGGTIHHADALHLNSLLTGPFDVVVTNPPWVRYQLFTGDRRCCALKAARSHGVELGGMASFWAPYLVHASSFLAPHGRLAAIVPAELLHADYAQPVRDFLLRRFRSIRLLAFEENAFPGAQVDALLLFAGDDAPPGPQIARIRNIAELDQVERRLVSFPASVSCAGARWNSLIVEADCLNLLGKLYHHASVIALGDIADVRIGVVTGADGFFLLNPAEVARHRIPRANRVPAITTLKGIAGLEVNRSDWLRFGWQERPTWMFHCDTPLEQLYVPTVTAYIRFGESQGRHGSFKCRSRRLWYRLPLPDPADALLTYMIGMLPRLVLNVADVTTTNLVHQVVFRSNAPSLQILAASFLSTLTQLSVEIEGRSYGGGVLKLEPSDARRVAVVVPVGSQAQDLESAYPIVDSLLRHGQVAKAVAMVDEIVLLSHLGLSMQTIERLRKGLTLLRSRRKSRQRSPWLP